MIYNKDEMTMKYLPKGVAKFIKSLVKDKKGYTVELFANKLFKSNNKSTLTVETFKELQVEMKKSNIIDYKLLDSDTRNLAKITDRFGWSYDELKEEMKYNPKGIHLCGKAYGDGHSIPIEAYFNDKEFKEIEILLEKHNFEVPEYIDFD